MNNKKVMLQIVIIPLFLLAFVVSKPVFDGNTNGYNIRQRKVPD